MAFKNFGVGTPPRKPGAPPPPFGGGASSAAPTKKPALAIAIGVGKPKPGAAPMGDEPMAPDKPMPDAGGGEAIPPEAVCYRTEMETCGKCAYNEGGNCSKLQIPIGDGDGCNLFKDRSSGEDADEAADSFEDEGAEQGQPPQ